ncbi:hypothetical protein SAMN05216302_105713 [Nitrosomonas aestuarii]|uniref:Uncharacterized protein n=1 Tax=Nitrosomonas aestuarii TaxID=52441 RepID=A0A1I4GMS2_9PROT|nr:hypothetical protein [Nitrosomonas aestuarii]SFL30461.1 hypothetical protein SAMN05216302_105713 [Nitrosomonas aestuarii]
MNEKCWISETLRADILQHSTDGASARKGHNCVILGVDMETERVIHTREGKSEQAVKKMAIILSAC